MPGDGNDECYLLTCNSWALVIGELLTLAYIRIMFGVDHVTGQPPKYCAFNIEPRSLPLRMVQGSLYLWDYRIHHWLFYLMLLPLFVVESEFAPFQPELGSLGAFAILVESSFQGLSHGAQANRKALVNRLRRQHGTSPLPNFLGCTSSE